jgi:cytochrome c-type biogenesis protein CcmH
MTWIIALALALAAFALAAFGFRLARGMYTTLLAALSLGLAGYALQASPNVPAAPARGAAKTDANFQIVEARREMLGEGERSSAEMLVVADAMARQGQFAQAAQFLNGVTRASPRDFEAWLAQGNALVEHADGVLTPAALYAYRRASALNPSHPAPGYFLGVSLIRQGQFMEARQVWADTLAAAPADAAGRAPLAERLARLDELLNMAAQPGPAQPPAAGE